MMPLDFDTQVITRDIACAPDRLFQLITDPVARASWGAPDAESVVEIDHAEIRPGGHELARCGPKEDPHFGTRMDFHVIAPDEHLIGSETLTVGGQVLSVALVTMEIESYQAGSRLSVTLQITSLAGAEMFEDYRGGWSGALDNLMRLAIEEAR
jgi:uncharacterized protein YndB with AHSA1/START domain